MIDKPEADSPEAGNGFNRGLAPGLTAETGWPGAPGLRQMASLCAAGAAVLALAGVLSWPAWLLAPSALLLLPMAPGTIVALLAVAAILALGLRQPKARAWRALAAPVATVLIVASLWSFTIAAANGSPTAESMFRPWILNGNVTEPASPAASLAMTMLAASLLMTMFSATTSRWRSVAAALTLPVVAGSGMAALGNLFASPFMYGRASAMGVLAGLGVLLAAAGTLAASGPGTVVMRDMVGPSLRSRLHRVFLPAALALALVQTFIFWFLHQTQQDLGLVTLVATVASLFLASAVAVLVAVRVGDDYDRTRGQLAREAEALRASEARYHSIVDHVNDGLCIFEHSQDAIDALKEGRLVLANPAFLKLYGYTDESQVLGRDITDFIALERRDETARFVGERSAGRPAPATYETVGIRSDGARLDLEIRVSAYELSGKHYTVGILRDVTEQKQAEVALRRSEAEFRAIFDNSLDSIHVHKNGIVVKANPAFLRTFGFDSFDQALGKPVTDLIAPESREFVAANIQAHVAGQPGLQALQVRCLRCDGSAFDTEVRVSTYQVGDERFSVTVLRDVTERSRAENALRLAHETNEAVLSALDDVVLVAAADTRKIVSCNGALERVTGYRPDELIGNTMEMLHTSPESRDAYLARRAAATLPDGAGRLEWRLRRRDGSIFESEHVLRSLPAIGDQPPRLLGVIRDISAQKQQERVRDTLAAISQLFLQENELPIIYRQVLSIITGNLGYSSAAFQEYDRATGEMVYLDAIGVDMPGPLPYRVPLDSTIAGQAPDSFEPLFLLDTGQENDSRIESMRRWRLRTWLGAPLRRGGSIFGVLLLADVSLRPEAAALLPTLQIIASHLSQELARRYAQEALRQANDLLDSTLAGMDDVVLVVDRAARRFVHCNQAVQKVFGYRPDEIIGASTAILQPDEPSFGKIHEALGSQMETSGQGRIQWRMRRKDGRVIPVELTLSLLGGPMQGKDVSVSLIRDISDRLAAEEALRQANVLLDETFASMDDVVLVVERGTRRVVHCNQALERVFGYRPDEIIGKSTWILHVDEESSAAFSVKASESVDSSGGAHFQWRMRRRDGVIIPTEHSLRLMETQYSGKRYTVSVIRDITARLTAEEALRASEERFRGLVESVPAIVWTATPNAGLEWASQRWYDYTGLPQQGSADPNAWQTFLHPDDLSAVMDAWEKAFRTGQPLEAEHLYRRHDGEYRWFLTRSSPLRDVNGDLVRWVGTSTDIHERKMAERALTQEKAMLAQAEAAAHMGSWRIILETGAMSWSDEMYKVFGLTRDEFGHNPREAIAMAVHPEDRPKVDAVNAAALHDGIPRPTDYRILRPDGSVRWVHAEGEQERDSSGKTVALAGFVMDITERRLAEQQTREARDLLQSILSNIGDSVLVLDARTRTIEMVNLTAEKMFGYKAEELIGRPTTMLHADTESSLEFNRLRTENADAGGVARFEHVMRRSDGTIFPTEHSVTVMDDPSGGRKFTVSIIRDITDRKRAEAALRERDARFASFMAHLPGMTFIEDADRRHVFVSSSMAAYFGIPCDQWTGRRFEEVVPGPAADDAAISDARIIETGQPMTYEITMLRDGEQRTFLTMRFPIDLEDGQRLLGGIALDVTDRAHAQESLRESERALAEAESLAHLGSYWRDAESGELHCSREMLRLLGLDPNVPVVPVQEMYDRTHPDDLPRVGEVMHAAIAERRAVECQHRLILPDGTQRHVLRRMLPVFDDKGRHLRNVGMMQDITERIHAEEALKESERALAQAQAIAHMGSYDYNALTDTLRWSDEVFRLMGVDKADFHGHRQDFRSRIHPDDYEHFMAFRSQVLASHMPAEGDLRIVRPNGEVRHLHEWMVPRYDSEGRHVGDQGTVLDVTEQRATAEALRKADALREQILASLDEVVMVVDIPSRTIISCNPAVQKVFGYRPEELIGRSSEILHASPERFRQFTLERSRRMGPDSVSRFDWQMRRKDGTLFSTEHSLSFLTETTGLRPIVSVVRDISDRKRAEEQMAASLKEKEILLREIHHRVKNNLQVIASLLSLQMQGLSDASAMVLRESQNRIRAMSIIHAKLYESRDIARVEFGGFVRDLGAVLFKAYGADPGLITLAVDAGKASMNIDTVIPCSLIVNELLANCVRHAFPGGRSGGIRVSVRRKGCNYTLVVADDGVGFPPGLDFRNTPSLGLQLVNMLSEQLNGDLELATGPGTRFTLKFQGRPEPGERE